MRPGSKMSSLYVFFGLIASGKSTLAEQFAGKFDLAYYNTDRVRKELAGIDPGSRQSDQFNQGIYNREFSRRTYQAMLDLASAEMKSGCKGVVLDGSYNSRDERTRVLELADTLDAGCIFIQCLCSDKVVRKRLELRSRDPHAISDGRWDIYLVQKKRFQPPAELSPSRLITVDTDQPVDLLVEYLATMLDLR